MKSYSLEELTLLTQSSLKELKLKFLPCKCPLCGKDLTISDPMDHQHMTSKETVGQNGAGLLRGMLCSNCNIFLGKIENNSRRYCIKDLIQWLRNCAEYLSKDNLPYVHYTETHRLKETISKSEYNKIVKYLKSKGKKYPKYPKNGYITKKLKEIKCLVDQEDTDKS